MLKMKMPNHSIEETFQDFLNSKRANGIKPKTIKTYQEHFHAISKELDTEADIQNLSKRQLEKMVVGMQTRGLSSNSIRSYTATLRSFLSWCNQQGITNVTIKLFRAQETIKTTYTDQELIKLLKKPNTKTCLFSEYRNWVIINLLLNSGCRASTVRSILVKDVDLDQGTISYRHTKNKKAQIVPLCQQMKKVLREYMRVRDGQQDQYLFPSQDNKMMTENGLAQAIRKYNLKRGVQKTSIHLFRHSFAQRFLRQGGNAFDLQRILGHSTLAMTRHYCRIYDTELVKDYDKFSPLSNLGK